MPLSIHAVYLPPSPVFLDQLSLFPMLTSLMAPGRMTQTAQFSGIYRN